jgi:hypothetical protein
MSVHACGRCVCVQHVSGILAPAGTPVVVPSLLADRAVVGILRLAVRFLRREDMAPQVRGKRGVSVGLFPAVTVRASL